MHPTEAQALSHKTATTWYRNQVHEATEQFLFARPTEVLSVVLDSHDCRRQEMWL
jgi:hypothetical protein